VLALDRRTDFVAASAEDAPQVSIDGAEVVFVGFGIQAPELQWDDFKGADLRGKVVLVLNNDPDWDPALFAGKRGPRRCGRQQPAALEPRRRVRGDSCALAGDWRSGGVGLRPTSQSAGASASG
jgi:hypothetical protein